MRILFICRGRPGFGHVSPALALDEHWRAAISGYESQLLTYALGLSASNFGAPVREIRFPYSGVGYPGLPVLRGLWPSVADAVAEYRPDYIIGSGEFLLPLFGVVEKIPVILLSNGRYLRARDGYFRQIHPVLAWMHEQASLVFDYSLDGEIHSHNALSNSLWVGPLIRRVLRVSRMEARQHLGLSEFDQIVLITKGGGEEFSQDAIVGKGDRARQVELNNYIIGCAIDSAALMQRRGVRALFILATGHGASYEYAVHKLTATGTGNVKVFPFISEVMAYMLAADVVIGRAGVSMIGEAAYCHAPQILTPVHTDTEQMENAEFMAANAAAIAIPTDQLSPFRLCEAIEVLLRSRADRDLLASNAILALPNLECACEIVTRKLSGLRL